MQFNNKIQVLFCASDDFGKLAETSREDMRCAVIYQRKKTDRGEKGEQKGCDLKIIVVAQAFSPYNQVYTNDNLMYELDGVKYIVLIRGIIRDFSSKPKYYEVSMELASHED